MFAIITVALLAGAVAERTRFWPWLLFTAVWVTVVYLPLAHWVFDPGGWLTARLHVLDFAGGTAVEVDSGAASLALVLVMGRRSGWPAEQHARTTCPRSCWRRHLVVRLVRVQRGLGARRQRPGGGRVPQHDARGRHRHARPPGARRARHHRVLAWVMQKTIGLRATREAELSGIDEAEHAETAYGNGRIGALHAAVAMPGHSHRGGAAKPPAA
jgi:hypothetical protein